MPGSQPSTTQGQDRLAEAREVLGILRDGRPRTRTELARITGRVRSTVTAQLETLIEEGLVVAETEQVSTGGRPSARYALDRSRRVLGAFDLGLASGRVAVTDLAGTILAVEAVPYTLADGSDAVLGAACAALERLVDSTGHRTGDLAGIGIGVPGPVDPDSGVVVSPALMPGWGGADLAAVVRASLGLDLPVALDNDVNVLALGEWVTRWAEESDIIIVKIGTGVGAGVIAGGRLLHGRRGAAGDIGHVLVPAGSGRLCRCGRTGCLEAVAGGTGIAQSLGLLGVDATSTQDVVALLEAGSPVASQVAREAGRAIGDVLAVLVAALNPAVVALGGDLVAAGDAVLAGVRESVFTRSQAAALSDLRVLTVDDAASAALQGCIRLTQNQLFGLPEEPVIYYDGAAAR